MTDAKWGDVHPVCWQCGGELKYLDEKPYCPVDGWTDDNNLLVPAAIHEVLMDAARAFELTRPHNHPIGCECYLCMAGRGLSEFGEMPEVTDD